MGRVFYYKKIDCDRRIMSDVWAWYTEYSIIDVDTLEFGITEECCEPIEKAYESGLITKEDFENLLKRKEAKDAMLFELKMIKQYTERLNEYLEAGIFDSKYDLYNLPCEVKTSRKYKGSAIFVRFEYSRFGRSFVVLTPQGKLVNVSSNTIKIEESCLEDLKKMLMEKRQKGEWRFENHLQECLPYMEVNLDRTDDETPSGKRKAWLKDERVKLRMWVDTCDSFSSLSLDEKERVTDNIMRKKYGTYE